jgi:hypothetical protein
MTAVEKNDGTLQLIFTPVKPSTITVTNPANGKNLMSLQYAAGEVIVITKARSATTSGESSGTSSFPAPALCSSGLA